MSREDVEKGENTLETSGEDVELHSKWVGKMWKYTRNECGRCGNALIRSPLSYLARVFTMGFGFSDKPFYTRFECILVAKSANHLGETCPEDILLPGESVNYLRVTYLGSQYDCKFP